MMFSIPIQSASPSPVRGLNTPLPFCRIMRVAIIGSGIGGGTARRVLQRLGAKVTVYERAPALFAVGAGITIAPNGLAILDQLGLLSNV
jgi:2-polyprenyl-6-methoxyphenol hydroxylase-like FAD-dependent oxidoreductase